MAVKAGAWLPAEARRVNGRLTSNGDPADIHVVPTARELAKEARRRRTRLTFGAGPPKTTRGIGIDQS